jgi:hypothetical protein
MYASKKPRMANQGPCTCDDCGKAMRWEGIDWCLMNALHLLCSLCAQRCVSGNRTHARELMESTPLRRLSVQS